MFVTEFQKTVAKYPHRIAIEFGTQTLTYQELDCLSRNLACKILSATPANKIIPIVVEKSLDYIISLIAIWKAGCAFCPVQPSLPIDRLNYILDEIKADLIVTSTENQDLAAKYSENIIFCDGADLSASTKSPTIEYHSKDLAYLIFTSGSTGEPKGVLIEHAGIVSMLQQQIKAFQLNEYSKSLFLTSISFDASISDIGTTLLAGACLVIEPNIIFDQIKCLEKIIIDKAITHIDLTPSLLKLLDLDKLKQQLITIIIGGEVAPVEKIKEFASSINIVNVYGPTEATICTSLVVCQQNWERAEIGKPLNLVEYYLDNSNQGETNTGELLIAGSCLARGYFKNGQLNQDKFTLLEGKRYYRTGDLVKLADDGAYIYLGRIDRMFKFRGLLIEPEEIERNINLIANVNNVVVLKCLKDDLEKIIAFVETSDPSSLSKNFINTAIGNKIPSWMLPHHYEFVQELPKTITNKVNISALKSFFVLNATAPQTRKTTYDALTISSLFQDVLNITELTPNSHFFDDLGGDSLAAIEIAVQAEKLGFKFSPSLIYQYPVFGNFLRKVYSKENTTAMSTNELIKHLEKIEFFQNLTKYPVNKSSHELEQTLITGANGFLGVQLIRGLLSNTKKQIICLIRAFNHNHASERLMQAFTQQQIKLKKSDLKRLVIMAGDLSDANFNLSATDWNYLKNNVKTVYHLAAKVNIVQTFQELEASNLGTTLNILEFAIKNGVREFHYISTLSVFVSSDHNQGLIRESDNLLQSKNLYGGYAQTKWLSEYAVNQLKDKFDLVKIYRLGLITGEIESGYCPENDQLKLFIQGANKLKCLPLSALDLAIDLSPVNYVAREIVRLAELDTPSNVFNIANRQSVKLRDIVKQIEHINPDFKVISDLEWQQKFISTKKLSFEEALLALSLSKILSDSDNYNARRSLDLFQATNVKFEVNNLCQIPPVSTKLLNSYLENFTQGL